MNTTIFIIYPHNTEEDLINEINHLGEITYPKKYIDGHIFHREMVFTKLAGFYILEELIKKKSKVLDFIKIRGSNGKEYSLMKFIDMVSKSDIIL